MVLNYYNLRQQPFGVAPDNRFLLMTRTHREALASLTYGLQEERGFLALVAPPGMGKTTLLFRLLESLRGRARTVFLFQTQCDPGDFCRYLVRDLGLTPRRDLTAVHEQLNQVLLEEARAGRRFVLIVDEAQGLKPEVLETIRLLSDFETPGRKLMQIIIAGQLSLVETLMRQDMEQLRQRISMVASLQPFNREEVAEYVGHRLKVAGHQGSPLFTEEALHLIADKSQGIPRNINNICFNALSIGFALKKAQIGREVLNEVLADLTIEALLRKKSVVALPPGPKSSLGLAASISTPFHRAGRKALSAGIELVAAARAVAKQIASRIAGVARPHTQSDIDNRHFGKYRPATFTTLQLLNPNLTSPDRIRVGRNIGIPANAAGAESTNLVGAESVRSEERTVSKNFEVLCRVEQEQVALTTESAIDVSVIVADQRTQVAGWKASSLVHPEIVKMVHLLFLSSANAPHHVLFCGVGNDDGSSRICASAAKALAGEVSSRVCLVDANANGPALDLADSVFPPAKSVEECGPMARQIDRNLWFVSAADLRSIGDSNGGAEQMCSALMELRKEFGYLLIDAPPLGAEIIASVLGQVTDGVVLILEANETRRVTARGAKQTLDAANVRLLGTVLNNRTFPIPEKLYRRL